MKRIEQLIENDMDKNQAAIDELDVLATLVEVHEDKYYPIPSSNLVDALLFIMDQQELSRKDMEQYLGSKSRVSEVLNGKATLSLKQIVRLHKGLGIPYAGIISETLVAA